MLSYHRFKSDSVDDKKIDIIRLMFELYKLSKYEKVGLCITH